MKRQRKTNLVIGILVVITFCFFAIGSDVAMAKPVELKVSAWIPPHIPPAKIMQKYAKAVEEQSGGTVKFTFYWASSLAKLQDNFRTVQTGLADIGMWVVGAVSGLTPLNEYISLPYLGFKDTQTVLKVFKEMQKKRPELTAEFKNMKYLYGYPMPPYHIHTAKKMVRTPEDLKGMKILADANATDFCNILGAVSVVKGPPDWYMSIQKGLVEGQLIHWNVVDSFKLEELFMYHTHMGPSGVNSLFLGWWMNQKTWERLDPQAQKVIMNLQNQFEQESIGVNAKQVERAIAAANKAGHPIIELSPQELEKWTTVGEKIQQKWIDAMEAKGKPGKAIFEETKRQIAKFNQE
jgi:TRAP-type C4-dicarboxylate transport system substrate-binding protein